VSAIVAGVVVNWLPALDHTRTGLPRLVDVQVVFYHRTKRALVLTQARHVGNERAENRRMSWKQNPVGVALKLQKQLESLPARTHGALAKHVGLSRSRVCQYLRLLELPADIISFLVDSSNEAIAATIKERSLQALLKSPAGTDIQKVFRSHFLSSVSKY